MALKILLCLAIATAIAANDRKALRKAPSGAKAVYWLIVVWALYCAFGFVTAHALPNLNDAVSALLREPGAAIDRALKAPEREAMLPAGKAKGESGDV